MAATMTPRSFARVLKLPSSCEAVRRTDAQNRLPTLTSAEVDGIFDRIGQKKARAPRAA